MFEHVECQFDRTFNLGVAQSRSHAHRISLPPSSRAVVEEELPGNGGPLEGSAIRPWPRVAPVTVAPKVDRKGMTHESE